MEPFSGQPGVPVAQFEIGSLKNFVYLILDWKTREAALVDPQKDLTRPLGFLTKNGFKLTHILLTHTHHDHIAGVPELARTHRDVPVLLHEKDLHRLEEVGKHRLLKDGEMISIGSLEVKAMHTPGHSAGEFCFLIQAEPPYLLTGDTVFIRDCGRTDFPTGSTTELFDSLQRIKKLPSQTVILPGHHYASETFSTLEKELRESPPFQCKTVGDLERLP